MSSGTGHTAGGTPTMPWVERAAREAHGAHCEAAGAHQDTGEILKMLRERDEEADPLAAISEGQLLTIERQAKVLDLLRTVLAGVGEIRTGQDGHALEMQALRLEMQTLGTQLQRLQTRCDETYDRLVRATTRPAQPADSPKPA
ncbi:hypothetical protein [Methylorubrum populi]|uniref:hypothetical protein n=1 Tax=Methylorubrum populi TaxID=223967 RepID=UPI003F656C8A